jgi:hypothetical protein
MLMGTVFVGLTACSGTTSLAPDPPDQEGAGENMTCIGDPDRGGRRTGR